MNSKPAYRIRERPHRLPRQCYVGEVTVAYTHCVDDDTLLFKDAAIVDTFLRFLRDALAKRNCIALVYCFMPDHLHVIVQGATPTSDTYQTMVDFKQKTGFWLSRNGAQSRWQKDFYDHIIRENEDLGAQVRYVANNPVRAELVDHWEEYPFTGAIGVDLKSVMLTAIVM